MILFTRKAKAEHHKAWKSLGGRINLDTQLDNLANTRQDIISSIGAPAALKLLQMSLFSVAIGSNDFINNYFTLRLYNLGARKVIVANVGPIGFSKKRLHMLLCCWALWRSDPLRSTIESLQRQIQVCVLGSYHPSDATNVIIAKRLLDGGSDDISLMNV
ncbi:hypothetical protein Ddye_019952 [Dipteronia dyeriana]|uniref:GDSL esterase/lipase n=1 Tax=Dipteronia dyeriana TaxID=168575 RepID=A0AAD9TZC5_9ROSI|nr:hypothetical protein Ddye_019952 [Dipteronia dyeriana]